MAVRLARRWLADWAEYGEPGSDDHRRGHRGVRLSGHRQTR